MSKTRNEERREIVNRRLAEINQEDIHPREEYTEAIQEDIPAEPQYPKNDKPNKLKTYALRIGIVIVIFLVLKNLDLGSMIDSSFVTTKNNDKIKVEAKINVPAEKQIDANAKIKYNFPLNKDENIIIFGKYNTKEEAIKEKNTFTKDFVEFPVNYFYLPEKSNSSEKIYQIYLGPIKGNSNAKQWAKLIGKDNIILSY